jgi:hypothetical protein
VLDQPVHVMRACIWLAPVSMPVPAGWSADDDVEVLMPLPAGTATFCMKHKDEKLSAGGLSISWRRSQLDGEHVRGTGHADERYLRRQA